MNKNYSLKLPVLLVFGIDNLMILIAIIRAILLERNPMVYFDEGGFISILSLGQLLFIAYLCWKISILRTSQYSLLAGWKNPSILWLVMTAGFIFLALDEWFMIHERVDIMLHNFLNLNPEGATDILDDLIILIYVIIGLLFLRAFKTEFKKFISASKWFLIGFIFSFLTVALDLFTQKIYPLSLLIGNHDKLVTIYIGFQVSEEIAKIFAEGAFIIGFCSCFIIAKKLRRKTKTVVKNQIESRKIN